MSTPISLVQRLRQRECGRQAGVRYSAVPPRLLISIRDLICSDHALLRGVAIGFTLCGRFLISYEADASASNHLAYYLLLWDFDDMQHIRLYARHQLFASTTFFRADTASDGLLSIFQHNLAINICQAPCCNPRCMVAQGPSDQARTVPSFLDTGVVSLLSNVFRTEEVCLLLASGFCFKSVHNADHFGLSYYPHFFLDNVSSGVHLYSALDHSYQLVFECSIAVRWLRFAVDPNTDLAASNAVPSFPNPPQFFSSSAWMKDVSRTANSPGTGSRIRTMDVSGFEPEHFLGQRIVRSNRAGLHVVLKDYSLHLSKTLPESPEIVVILVANMAVQGVCRPPLVVTLVIDFHRKMLEIMRGDHSILGAVLATCQTGAPALVVGAMYCKILQTCFDSPRVPLPSEFLSNATMFLGRSKQRIDNPVYPYAIISYS